MFKTQKSKVLFAVVILLAVLFTVSIIGATIAYYNAQRKASGSATFDNGIYLTLTNVEKTNSSNTSITGSLLYYPSGVKGSETAAFNVSKVEPASSFIIASPQIVVDNKSVDFYARMKFDIKYFDLTNETMQTYKEITASTLSMSDSALKAEIFDSVLEFAPNWQDLSSDGYYYYTSTSTNQLQAIVAGQTIDVLSNDEITFKDWVVLNGAPHGIDKIEYYLTLEVIETSALGVAPGWS